MQSTHYWYFPGSGQSNGEWKFVGYFDEMVEEYVAAEQPSYGELGQVELTSRQFTVNNNYPQRMVTFGKDFDGYARGVEDTLTFAEIVELKNGNFISVREFEDKLLSLGQYKLFGQNLTIQSGIAMEQCFVGALYALSNPETGMRDYFMMKKVSAVDFPTDQTSNDDWKFLKATQKLMSILH